MIVSLKSYSNSRSLLLSTNVSQKHVEIAFRKANFHSFYRFGGLHTERVHIDAPNRILVWLLYLSEIWAWYCPVLLHNREVKLSILVKIYVTNQHSWTQHVRLVWTQYWAMSGPMLFRFVFFLSNKVDQTLLAQRQQNANINAWECTLGIFN